MVFEIWRVTVTLQLEPTPHLKIPAWHPAHSLLQSVSPSFKCLGHACELQVIPLASAYHKLVYQISLNVLFVWMWNFAKTSSSFSISLIYFQSQISSTNQKFLELIQFFFAFFSFAVVNLNVHSIFFSVNDLINTFRVLGCFVIHLL